MATVNGTSDIDKLFIGAGKSGDTLLGLAGNDTLDATTGAGGNILRGGDGDDELFAYTNDQLFGDAGDDKLYSDGNGNNTLAGGDGTDTIYADRNDTVSGDAGDDTIYAGKGGNTLTGGAGKDVFWIANVDVPTTPNTITDFDRVNDTIRLNLTGVKTLSDLTIVKSGNDATISLGTQQLVLLKNTATTSLNSNTVVVDPKAANNSVTNKVIATTDSANLNLNLKDFNTKVTGDSRDNIIDASTGGGDNQIFAGDGADELYAYQNDKLFGEAGNDILDARIGKGGNTLDGGIGDDKLFAGTNDTLIGGDGDDTLFAGLGGNTLTGSNGKDTFILATGSLPTKSNIITDFKAGTDTLKIVGVPGIGDDITKLTTVIQGSDTLLKAGGVDLALIKGIQATSIDNLLNPPTPLKPTTPLPGIVGATNNLFITDATATGWSINAVSQKAGVKVNQIGFFAIDDPTGKVGGIAPGAAGYLSAVATAAKPIFSTLNGSFFKTDKREIALDPSKTYEFFQIQDGSIEDFQQQISSGKTPTNMLFSLPDASGKTPFVITTNSTNDGYKVSVNSDELVFNVGKLASTAPNVPVGAKSQTLTQGRTIDLSDYTGKMIKADIVTTSDAAYNNNIGFYAIEDAIGTIKTAAGTFKPGDASYAIEAIKSAVLSANKTDSKLAQDGFIGGKIYAPVVVAQGTLTDFVSKNVNNNSTDPNAIHAYFNYLGANPDKLDHFRLLGNNTFGVEDLYGSGDRDFNDVVVNMTIKVA
jgi:Ca2+-binding RTX toxin-like protein